MVNGVTQIDLPSCIGDSSRDSEVTLPSFVAGPENRFAAVAMRRLLDVDLVDADSCLFNPLVLVGPTGSGKSHLARGIARRFHQLSGQDSVEYFTAIDFARQLHVARDANELVSFRQRLANLRLLIVEDLQRLPHRVFVQRELRDTIDALVAADRTVLFTAQQPPATMLKLETGLRDRLASGLLVQLRLPGLEARREILGLVSASRSISLSEDRLDALAKKVDGPAPMLLRALAELELTGESGQATSLDQLREPIRLKQIVAVVARYFSLTQAAMRSPTRRKSLVYARGVVIHLARKLTDVSYAQIGQGLGRRDHSTIMHAHRNIERQLAEDPVTQKAVDELQRILTAV